MDKKQKTFLEQELLKKIYALKEDEEKGLYLMATLKSARVQGLLFDGFYEMAFYSYMPDIKREDLLIWSQNYAHYGLEVGKAQQYFENFFDGLSKNEKKKVFHLYNENSFSNWPLDEKIVEACFEHKFAFSEEVMKFVKDNCTCRNFEQIERKNIQLRTFTKLDDTLDEKEQTRPRNKL